MASRKFTPMLFLPICSGSKRNGTRPNHFCLGSASVARKALQSLEGMKLVVKDSNGGRSITPQGQKDMDRIAAQVLGFFLIKAYLALYLVCAKELGIGNCFLQNFGLIENWYVSIESAFPNKDVIPLSCCTACVHFQSYFMLWLKMMCIEMTTFHIICFDERLLNSSLFSDSF